MDGWDGARTAPAAPACRNGTLGWAVDAGGRAKCEGNGEAMCVRANHAATDRESSPAPRLR